MRLQLCIKVGSKSIGTVRFIDLNRVECDTAIGQNARQCVAILVARKIKQLYTVLLGGLRSFQDEVCKSLASPSL